MTTLNDLVDEVLSELHGQTSDLEQVTFCTAPVGLTDTTITLDDASQLSRGLIEIDDELLWVTRIDPVNNIAYIAPFGRGYRDTTAATHLTGTMVTNDPRFPRFSVIQKIQQAISEMYPEFFVVGVDESNTVNPVQITYPVPANCDIILSLRWQTVGPSQEWLPVKSYRFNSDADTAAFPTGRSVDIKDAMFPGQTIRITYTSRPAPLVNETDTLASVGLDDGVRDVIVYGACYRLVAGLEISRLQTTTVEQGYDRQTYVGSAGAATAGSKYYLSLFQERLDNERQRLLQIYPTTTHMSR